MYIVELNPFIENECEEHIIERYNHFIQNLYHKPECGIILYGNPLRSTITQRIIQNDLLQEEQIFTSLDNSTVDKIEQLILENKKYIISILDLDEIPTNLEGLYETSIIVHAN